MIELGRMHPWRPIPRYPRDIKLGLARKNECAAIDEFDKYAKKKPARACRWPLPDSVRLNTRPCGSGYLRAPSSTNNPGHRPDEARQIAQWEAFFNQAPLRNQLVARYLFAGTCTRPTCILRELDTGNFFELVRSIPAGTGHPDHRHRTTNDDPDGPCTTAGCARVTGPWCTRPICPIRWVPQNGAPGGAVSVR